MVYAGVTYRDPSGSVFVEGRIEGVDAQGNLLIKSGQGSIVAASSGEVHVRRLN